MGNGGYMNKVFLIGRLTNDIELATTNSGVSVCRFTIAVQRRFENADGEKESDFFNCVAWRGIGENISKYCKKGNKIGVIGELQNRSYDAQDGTKRYITEIIVNECEFLQTKNSNSNNTHNTIQATQPELEPITDDQLPF